MENTKDVKTLNPTQQPVQEPIQAQNSLPLPVLSTAPLTSPTIPRLRNKQQRRTIINRTLIRIAIVITIVATALWALNAIGVIHGPWAGLFAPLAASIGVVIHLIRLQQGPDGQGHY